MSESIIVWVLTIGLHGGYQSMQVKIEFPTEARCEAARVATTTRGAGNVGIMCMPAKREKPRN